MDERHEPAEWVLVLLGAAIALAACVVAIGAALWLADLFGIIDHVRAYNCTSDTGEWLC